MILILCGSAASWMLDNVIHDRGGLHNRITRRILLRPFNLRDTQKYVNTNKLNKSTKQILDMYMVLGGIPLYLQQIKRGLSAAQNIEQICFNENGLLFDEFEKLYRSLFTHHEEYIQIVKAIALRHYGISIKDLLITLKKNQGGDLLSNYAIWKWLGLFRNLFHLVKNQEIGITELQTNLQAFIIIGKKST